MKGITPFLVLGQMFADKFMKHWNHKGFSAKQSYHQNISEFLKKKKKKERK